VLTSLVPFPFSFPSPPQLPCQSTAAATLNKLNRTVQTAAPGTKWTFFSPPLPSPLSGSKLAGRVQRMSDQVDQYSRGSRRRTATHLAAVSKWFFLPFFSSPLAIGEGMSSGPGRSSANQRARLNSIRREDPRHREAFLFSFSPFSPPPPFCLTRRKAAIWKISAERTK